MTHHHARDGAIARWLRLYDGRRLCMLTCAPLLMTPRCGKGLARRKGIAITPYTNNPTAFTWDAGSPRSNVHGAHTGQYLTPAAVGTGVQFTVALPDAAVTYAVHLYVGLYCAEGELTVTAADAGGVGRPMYTGTFNDTLGPGIIRDGTFIIVAKPQPQTLKDNDGTGDGIGGARVLSFAWVLQKKAGLCQSVVGNLEFQGVAIKPMQ